MRYSLKSLILIMLCFYTSVVSADIIDDIINKDRLTSPFIVANKEDGTLTLVNPTTNSRQTTSALYGKLIADNVDIRYYDRVGAAAPFVTPAGVYQLTKMYSDTLHKNVLVYYEGNTVIMSIHSVYTGNPVQQRLKRLKSDNPKLRRITNGCINVDVVFFDQHLFTLAPNTLLYILPETEKVKKEWDRVYKAS